MICFVSTHRVGPQDVFYFPFDGNCKYAQFPRAFFFSKWEAFSESSSFGYRADRCPGPRPLSVTSDMPVRKIWSLIIIVIICYMAVLYHTLAL